MNNKITILICLSLSFYSMLYSYPEKNYFILGREEGEGLLVYPRQIKEGPDGNIYAYDQSDAFIKVYSPKGKYIRKIGGKGQGPGEIQRAEGFNFEFSINGKLYFTEFFGGHTWITIMEI